MPGWHDNSATIFRLDRQGMGLMLSQLQIFIARSILWVLLSPWWYSYLLRQAGVANLLKVALTNIRFFDFRWGSDQHVPGAKASSFASQASKRESEKDSDLMFVHCWCNHDLVSNSIRLPLPCSLLTRKAPSSLGSIKNVPTWFDFRKHRPKLGQKQTRTTISF